MNLLSYLATVMSVFDIILGVQLIQKNSRSVVHWLAAAVDFCFAIWATAFAFMYSAANAETAIFWNQVGSIGWILIGVFTAEFNLALAEKGNWLRNPLVQILLSAWPAVLLVRSLTGPGTIAVSSMVQTRSGLGWGYVSSFPSVWFWQYILYLSVYLAASFYISRKWVLRTGNKAKKRQMDFFISSIAAMLLIGCFTDLLLPVLTPGLLPPICIIVMVVWSINSRTIVNFKKLIRVDEVVTPDMILDTVINPILLMDRSGQIISCNQAASSLVKFETSQIIGRPFSDFFQNGAYDLNMLNRLLSEKKLRNDEINLVDATGRVINTLTNFSVADNSDGEIAGIVASIHDVTQIRQYERSLHESSENYRRLSSHLEQIANIDDLTRLPNRRMFFDQLEAAISRHASTGAGFSLVFIDLDGFKAINDNYGHAIGDQALLAVAGIFQSTLRKNDLIARVGGDEFTLLIDECADDELDNLLERIRDRFKRPLVIDGRICPLGVSMGISRCPEDNAAIDELMRLADERMYREKTGKQDVG